jgi:hypothetical protein
MREDKTTTIFNIVRDFQKTVQGCKYPDEPRVDCTCNPIKAERAIQTLITIERQAAVREFADRLKTNTSLVPYFEHDKLSVVFTDNIDSTLAEMEKPTSPNNRKED